MTHPVQDPHKDAPPRAPAQTKRRARAADGRTAEPEAYFFGPRADPVEGAREDDED